MARISKETATSFREVASSFREAASSGIGLDVDGPYEPLVGHFEREAELFALQARHRHGLAAKYRRAMIRPWELVEADGPDPVATARVDAPGGIP